MARHTKTLLVHEFANLAWRQNGSHLIEASLFDEASLQLVVQSLSALGYTASGEQEHLKAAAGILEYRKHKGIEWHPDAGGFVFSKEQFVQHDQRLIKLAPAHLYVS
jgi:hypothetical protein